MSPEYSARRIPLESLERYAVGECDPVEAARIAAAIAEQPHVAEMWNTIRTRIVPREARDGGWDAHAGLGELWRTLDREHHVTGVANRTRRRPWIAGGIAAVIAAAVVFAVQLGRAPDAGPAYARTYTTKAGQSATVRLTDGTRVTLAPSSVLRIASRFGATSRDVSLDGEGYFEVVHASGAPFIVHTGHVTTRVLGTSFVVRRHTGDSRVHVAVITGKVAVSAHPSKHSSVTVTAGHAGEATDSSATITTGGSTPVYATWTNGRMVFHDTPAAHVLSALERWYGYNFRITDSAIAKERMTTELSTRSSAEALATLKLLLDVDMTFDGNVVTLVSRKTRPAHAPERRGAYEALRHHTNGGVGR